MSNFPWLTVTGAIPLVGAMLLVGALLLVRL